MKIVYVAGPYRARTLIGKVWNIIKAYRTALRLSRQGHIVFCPHANTALFDLLCHHDEEFWLEAGREFLSRFDSIYLMKGWGESVGSIDELALARKLGKEVIFED